MRFLITILILIISFNCVAQFPNNPTQGAVQTNNQFLGAITAQKGIVAGTFTDTTAANSATYIKTVPFIMISCTTPNAIYFRNASATGWVQLLPSGGGSGGGYAWNVGGNSLFNSASGNFIFGIGATTTGNYSIDFRTRNTTRFILDSTGILPLSARSKPLGIDSVTGILTYASGGSSSIPISSLLAATGTNDINNANYEQIWRWNTLGDNSGLFLLSNSTEALNNGQILLNVQLSGANANINETTRSAAFVNSHTGTNSVNIGVQGSATNATTNTAGLFSATGGTTNTAGSFTASGGTNNIAINVISGDVKLQSLASASNAADSMVVILPATGKVGYRAIPSSGGTPGIDDVLSINQSLTADREINSNSHRLSIGRVSSANYLYVSNGTSKISIGDEFGNVNGNNILVDDDNSLAYYDNTAHAGFFGINTNAPTGELNVYNGSSAYLIIDATNGIFKMGDIDGNINATSVNVDAATDNILLQSSTATITAAAIQFTNYGAGTLTTDGSGNITAVSDRRAKHNIKGFTYGLAAIKLLKPSTFVYNADSTGTVMSGFIAQDVQKAIPIAVHDAKTKDGYLSLEVNAVTAALVNAVNELSDKVDKLEKQNAELVKKLAKNPKKVVLKY